MIARGFSRLEDLKANDRLLEAEHHASEVVTPPSKVVVPVEEAPLSLVWDSKTERVFARLVDQDISSRTPPLTKGIS